MRCIIIDDEKLALDLLENNIARIPFLDLAGRFTSPYDALAYLQQNNVDLVFVDIHMPGLTGLEMLAGLKSNVQVVIVSAYEKYAFAGFNLDVTDYLLKPVSFERFLKACVKCQELYNYRNAPASTIAERKYFFVNVEYAQVKIDCGSIVYIESMRDYIKIFLKEDKPVMTRMSLKAIEEKLDRNDFMRVHKSYIVNTHMISSIRKGMVQLMKHEVPVSENYREALIKKLRIDY